MIVRRQEPEGRVWGSRPTSVADLAAEVIAAACAYRDWSDDDTVMDALAERLDRAVDAYRKALRERRD